MSVKSLGSKPEPMFKVRSSSSKQGSEESEFGPVSEEDSRNVFIRCVDSFRRKRPEDEEKILLRSNRGISKRHLQFMALSTGVGTGLLVASGSKLKTAGPLFLLIGYLITGYFMLVPCINAAGELTVAYNNLSGGFQSYFRKFIDESAAFAIGWNYCIQWFTLIALELVTASITIKTWTTSVDPDVFVAIFLVVVVTINAIGAKGYGEAEFVMNSLKVLAIVGFIIFGIVIDCGGGPDKFIGGQYWHHPGAYTSFKGLCTVFVTSAFAYAGTELIALSAADQQNPRDAIPSACKLVFFRITVFFLGSLLFVGLLVPSDSDELMGSGSSATHSSPFFIAAKIHGVIVVAHIMNAVILISVTSVATSAMYSASRILQALAEQGFAPKFFNYTDRKGRPARAWLATVSFSFFAFIATYKKEETVFNWLLSISALSLIFVWSAICICHIRFRAALKYRGIPLSSLAYVSSTGLPGSYLSLTLNMLILICQFWVALFPVGSDGPDVLNFFENYLGVIVVIVFYIGHKLCTRKWSPYIKVEDIDLDSDRTIYDPEILELEREEEKQRFKNFPIWKKILKVCFG